MRRFAVAWLLCVIASGVAAQAPERAPTAEKPLAQPQGDPSGNKAAEQPQRAAPPPIIVNVQPPPHTEAEAQKEERERQEKANLDRRLVELTGDLAEYTKWLAWATAALFAVTAGLFALSIRQAGDAKRAGEAASASAEAAKLSAEGAVRAERAIIVVASYIIERPPGPRLEINPREPPYDPILKYRIVNLGRTPAEIKSYCLEVFIGEELPSEPVYERVYEMLPDTFLTRDVPIRQQEIFQLTGNARDYVLHDRFKLIFYGYVRWLDYLGASHETRFCTRALPYYQKPGEWFAFVLDGDTPEAYTRRT